MTVLSNKSSLVRSEPTAHPLDIFQEIRDANMDHTRARSPQESSRPLWKVLSKAGIYSPSTIDVYQVVRDVNLKFASSRIKISQTAKELRELLRC